LPPRGWREAARVTEEAVRYLAIAMANLVTT
jgi:hypothetical protein